MAQPSDMGQSDAAYVLVPQPPNSMQDDLPEVFRLPLCNGQDLYEVSVDELQHLFTSGALTSEDYVQFCLDHVQKTNPYLECVIETNPEALKHARTLDGERKDGKIRGPLHGIPVFVKDNMATADRMQTTAGSWALLGCIVPKDAHIVSLLRKAGAVILGKTNLDEWAGMRGTYYSLGYSARGGQCRNPYLLNRSANGSSSGSAVAVSANIVPLAFGTETDCSVISPGMVNGVVAIKPTVGLTSRGGIIPISETQDSIGSYGRCVADAAVALDAIAGPDSDDKYSTQPDRRQPKSYCDFLTDRHALKGARFGLPIKRFWEVAPYPQRAVAEKVLQLIKEAGADIIPVDMPCAEERLDKDGVWDWERYGDDHPEISEITVSKVQTYYLMNEYLAKLKNTPIRTLEDVVQFNDDNRGSEGGHAGDLPAFPDGQRLFRKCVETKGIKDETYFAALKHIQSQCRENGIDAALRGPSSDGTEDGQPLDALLFCDVKAGGIQIAAQAGYPVMTMPIGLDPDGMPLPLTLQHTAWQEDKLVKWASAIEDLLKAHNEQQSTPVSSRSARLGRIPPTYKNHLRKNIPVDQDYQWPGRHREQA
ncbi:hypothetical protein HRR80_001930 [Exophiala dermatitidis]|uniref:Amidase domain-containing protein n=1 Tax=Exophiala dermatitidis TaxID=5970 RepID=A0AAN6F0N1_EXODE|nr:hypothetical protein HRR77_005276 [Exophiala dermatitidis]KAJ4543515.1 hypothetical protein HRR76_001584 [Exophiala dermatitidis]KAJ4587959.1 hypothetical protein HRR82_001748 [Exophiala dermatitidis]KAJ4628252.1 hypothetical protein HRR86_003155 [Exophiala dermatitidis]KAJ4694884.1 hypothetical protein HRR87_003931 [Exophiala dermatitidis]